MINPFADVNWTPRTAEMRRFAASLVIGVPAVAAIHFLFRGMVFGSWPVESSLWMASAALIGVFLWFFPSLGRPFYLVWFAASCTIGFVVSNTVMAMFYLVVFSLVAIVVRVLGRSNVRMHGNRRAVTYWQTVEKNSDPTRYYNQS